MDVPLLEDPPQNALILSKGQVLVSIPAYNEEKRVGEIVRKCLATGADVCIIDDGSTDATSIQAQKAGASIIKHEHNLGKGTAIRSALKVLVDSRYQFLILMDADGQHDPSLIPAFIQRAITARAELLLGNRMQCTEKMPIVRKWTNQFMSWLISCLVHQYVPDSQCGYRLLTRTFVEKFHPTTNRFDLESEMLIQAGRLGFKIDSIPISTIYEGPSSHIHPFWDTLRFVKLILKYLR